MQSDDAYFIDIYMKIWLMASFLLVYTYKIITLFVFEKINVLSLKLVDDNHENILDEIHSLLKNRALQYFGQRKTT